MKVQNFSMKRNCIKWNDEYKCNHVGLESDTTETINLSWEEIGRSTTNGCFCFARTSSGGFDWYYIYLVIYWFNLDI